MTSKESRKVVVVDFNDVAKDHSDENSLSAALEQAFGSTTSLGILAIRNVPGFVQAKQTFLPMAHELAHLPQEYLENDMADPTSMYNAGWSHGKEKLGDQPDYAKGSFYFNPLTDTPGSPEDRINYPASYPCNLWPDDHIPQFKKSARHIGAIMKDVVVHLSKHIDRYAKDKLPAYDTDALCNAMKRTEKAKGRLLYYFPLAKKEDGSIPSQDSWIGWHNDSGFLTALAGDLYINDETGQVIDCPDPDAGLYVVDRNDQVVHVHIPSDCMAVQMGECVQIMTGGIVMATPHCVRGANTGTLPVSRISFPCFIDTPPDFPLCMPMGCTRLQVLSAGVGTSRVPPLSSRWTHDGMVFGDFLAQTFSMYYDWTKNASS